MSASGFKQYKIDASVYYFIDKETKELVIAIVYIYDIYFIDLKYFPLFLELNQKFMMKWECCDFGETKEFLKMYISHNCKVLQSQDLRVGQVKEPCIRINTRKLNRELCTESSILYTKLQWSMLLL